MATAIPPLQAQILYETLPIDGYAATINERVVTISDVYMSIREMENRLRMMYSGDELRKRSQELFLSGLERQIDQALILEDFSKQTEMQIPDRIIEDHINQVVAEKYNNDRAALLAALAGEQMTLDEWRESIREGIIIRLMRNREVNERIMISPRDVLEAYESSQDRYHQPEKIQVRLIFLKHIEPPEKNLERITEIRNRIETEDDFIKVAKEVSEDPSASNGGDWGRIEPRELRDDLRKAIDTLEVNQISPPVETPEGYYILLIRERQPATTKSFEEVHREIEAELREKQGEQLFRDWLKRLRNKYTVIYHIPVPPAP